jgi:uncharacterized protein
MATKTFLLEYTYIEGILEKRTPHREAHLALAKDYIEKGVCVAAGPFADASGALFLFHGDHDETMEHIHHFMQADSYVKAGLVPSYSVREWTVGLGKIC